MFSVCEFFSVLYIGSLERLRKSKNKNAIKAGSDSTFITMGMVSSTAAAAKSLQSCPTLRDPIDGLLPGSSVPGFLQARTLEWVVISFSNA